MSPFIARHVGSDRLPHVPVSCRYPGSTGEEKKKKKQREEECGQLAVGADGFALQENESLRRCCAAMMQLSLHGSSVELGSTDPGLSTCLPEQRWNQFHLIGVLIQMVLVKGKNM